MPRGPSDFSEIDRVVVATITDLNKTNPVRKFFRATYSVAIIALFLAAVVLGFTQTKLFRTYLRTRLVQAVASDLHGELVLSSLEGNLFTGFQVENVVLRRDGEPVLTVEKLDVKYDPLGLLTKSVTVSRLVLTNPAIHLTRSAGGEWNFHRFLRSSSPDTTASSWTINLKQIQIRGGALEIVDSLGLAQRTLDSSLGIEPGRFNYSNIALDSLNLEGSLSIHPGEIGLSFKSLACRSPLPHFRLKNFAGDFILARKSVSVRKMKVETEKSKLHLDARFDNIDITKVASLAQLQFVPVSVRLNIERLDFGEMKQVIGTPVKFLEHEVAGQIDLEGRFGLIDVRNVTIHSGSSTVRIAGTVANLHTPKELELDLACIKNRVDPVDLRHLMPTLGIPDLSALGFVDYELRFKGKPTSFNAKLLSTSQVGKVDVDGNIDVRDGTMSYDGTIKTTRFNVAPLAGDSALTSSLKATITIQGRGTRLIDITSLVRMEIDSSECFGLPVSRSVAVVDIADRAIRPRVSLRIGSARIDLGGTLQLQPQDVVQYDLSGRINSLNLSDVTKKREHESDVSFDLQAKGRMKTVAALSGDITLNVFRSSFDTLTFEGGSARIRINTLDQEPRTLNLTSDIVDLDVQGHFTPATVLSAIIHGASSLGDAARYRVNSMDSLRTLNSALRSSKEFRTAVSPGRDSTECTVKLDIKDCFPLGVLLGRELDGRLSASGRVKEASNGIQWSGIADVPEFSYSDKSVSFSLKEATLSYGAYGLFTPDMLRSMKLSASIRARQFDFQDQHASNFAATMNIKGDSGWFSFGALLDSLVTVGVQGSGAFANQLLALDIHRLQLSFSSSEFTNTEPVQLRVGRDGLQIGNLRMQHEGEELWASGYFDPAGVSDISVAVKNLIADNIPRMFRHAVNHEPLPAMNGLVNGVATFKGSFEEPQFTAELNATGVEYQGRNFGQIVVRSSYAERLLNVFAQLNSRPDSAAVPPELLVNGTVPYNLSLKGESARKLEGEMNLDVRSTRFPLEFLDPFIPELSNLTGSLVCDMKLRGTVESPTYDGSVVLQNARFHFDPLGIDYIVNGKLVPQGIQIAFQDMTVRNIPEDRPDGRVELSGRFSLEGLRIKDFDLIAHGQLLVMKESARLTSQGLYGDLFVGTGSEGISWKGRPSRSTVSGEVFVMYANLTLPPTRQAQDLPSSGIKVSVIDDIGIEKKATEATATKGPGTNPRSSKTNSATPEIVSTATRSFLDNIVYNLSVETQGVTQLRFVFSNFTNEQLFAELKGRTVFTRDSDQMYLSGELDLGNRSYYSNFKKLDATGNVKFTGDPLNPELNVVASYEGVHRDTTGTSASSSGAFSGGSRGTYQKVVVRVYITGTREQPKVKMGLEQYDQLGNLRPERADVQADAFAFLVTGAFPEEFTQQDKMSLAGSNVLGGVASSILSGPLTDLLRKEFGIVRSVDVLYYGGGTFQESADVRLTGELGDAVFRLGGRVLSDLNNTNVSIQVPMSSIVGSPKWHHLVLEAERRVEGVETIDQRRESRELRLLYRIIF